MSSEDLIREAQDPATPPARLAELAQIDRSTWAAIVFNPAAYDGLLQWLGERGDPTVSAALAARASHAATLQAPSPAAAAPTPDPTPEPTAVIPEQPVAHPAQQPAYGEAPTAAGGGNGGSGRPLGLVIAMVVVIIALIGGAAFGATQVFGGDDDDDSPVATETQKTESPDTSDDEDTPTTGAPAEESPVASTEFCTTMKDIQDASMDLLDSNGSTPDLDAIQRMAADMTASYTALESSAPPELRADVEVMGSYFDLMNNPTAESASKMSDSIDEYSQAAQNVGVYYAQNCL